MLLRRAQQIGLTPDQVNKIRQEMLARPRTRRHTGLGLFRQRSRAHAVSHSPRRGFDEVEMTLKTIPFGVIDQLVKHPLTDLGIEKFLADWKKLEKK